MPAEVQWVQITLQGGSFALLAVIVFWCGKYAFPRAMDSWEKSQDKFTNSLVAQQASFQGALDRLELRHERDGDRRDKAMLRLAEAIEQLERRVGDRRSCDDPNYRGPLRRAADKSPKEAT